jgi:DNA-directed RNA polymerase subunit RPC12/RpoP
MITTVYICDNCGEKATESENPETIKYWLKLSQGVGTAGTNRPYTRIVCHKCSGDIEKTLANRKAQKG